VQEAIAEVFLQLRRLGSVRQVLLWYRQEKARCVVTDAMRTAGSALGLAGLQAHSGDFEEPGLRRAFAYGRTSTRSRIIEGRARKTAGDSVPVEQGVRAISFWYSTG
jgi:hypothetical protein